jgi:hypothetical protein
VDHQHSPDKQEWKEIDPKCSFCIKSEQSRPELDKSDEICLSLLSNGVDMIIERRSSSMLGLGWARRLTVVSGRAGG